MPPVSKNIPAVWNSSSMEQDEHQQRHQHAEVVEELRHPVKAGMIDLTTAGREQQQENVVTLAYKRSIDERDKSSGEKVLGTTIPASDISSGVVVHEEGRDEDSKRQKCSGSTPTSTNSTTTSFAIIDDRDYQPRPSVAFTKSTDTRDNELSPVGSACGGRKGPESLIQRLEEEERIVFVPQEHQQWLQQQPMMQSSNATSDFGGFHHGTALNVLHERDELSPCYAADPLANSVDDFVYSTVLHDAALSPMTEREHIVMDLEKHVVMDLEEEHESTSAQPSDTEDIDSLSMEDVFLGPEATSSAVDEKTETYRMVETPQEPKVESYSQKGANSTLDDKTPALAVKPEADTNNVKEPGDHESNWVEHTKDHPQWVMESFIDFAMTPEEAVDPAHVHRHQIQHGSENVDTVESADKEVVTIQPIVVSASGAIKTERDAILLSLGAATSFASDYSCDIESGPAVQLDGKKEPGVMLAKAVSDSFLVGLSTLETDSSMTLKRTVSEPLLCNSSVSSVQGNHGPFETILVQQNDDARLEDDRKDEEPATVDTKVSAAAMIEGRQSSDVMTDHDMNIKIDAARKASISTSVGAFSEMDPRAAFDVKDKTDEKMFLVDIPVQQSSDAALAPSDSTDVEMAFARASEHTPNTSTPGAYHEGGNRGIINMGDFSHSSRSSSATMFSSDENTIDLEHSAPLTAQLVDEDKLRLQAERDAEEALRRLMDQAVQGQAIVIGDEDDGELDGVFSSNDKRKEEQPRKLYRRSLALAFALICALIVTVVMLTRPEDDPPVEPVVVPEAKTWMQLGPDIDGEQPNESWGSSVALSANAKMLAGGKPTQCTLSISPVKEKTLTRRLASFTFSCSRVFSRLGWNPKHWTRPRLST
jgi:hypothetical protein